MEKYPFYDTVLFIAILSNVLFMSIAIIIIRTKKLQGKIHKFYTKSCSCLWTKRKKEVILFRRNGIVFLTESSKSLRRLRKAIRVGVDLLSYSQEEKVMGKKVSDFLKSEILSSVFYLAFGLCLLLVPDQTVNIICKIVFGLVMIASGIYHIVIYTAEKEKATILDLFTGVIVMVLGIFLFFTPQIVIKILPYLLGALVLVDSIWKIKGSYRLKKAQRGRWKIILIGCLVFIALGVSMLLYSFLSVTRMILFSGIILTADGVADIVFLIMIRLGMKKSEKLCAEKEQEENGKEKPWDDPEDAGLDEKCRINL